MDPFSYGRVVQDDEFCPRPALAESLLGNTQRRQNTVLIGERRMGKTSLIFDVVNELSKTQFVYVDLLEIKTIDDFVDRIARALVLFRSAQGLLTNVLDTLKALKPSVSVDPITGMPNVSLDARTTKSPATLEALLEIIGDFGKKDGLIVVLDEFQDVLKLKDSSTLIALLRSKIQFQKKVTYIYSGSVRSDLESIFVDPESPLFKSTARLYVGPIDRKQFRTFLKARFASTGRHIKSKTLNLVFDEAQDVPGDIQELCSALWSITDSGDEIKSEHIPKALELIFSRELKAYEMLVSNLSAHQARVLATLARHGGETVMGKEFIKHSGIVQPSSIKKAVVSLQQKRIILKRADEYCFVNPFFAAWLRHKGYY